MAIPPPKLDIPHSDATIEVSIIDTTSHVTVPAGMFMQPEMAGNPVLSACCYAFLLKHKNPSAKASKHDTLLWDLGVRKDFENSPKAILDRFASLPPDSVKVEKNVAEILSENNVDLNTIGGIIWSHHHLDHTGDPSTFPSSTDLIVGPGFKSAFVPCYPTIPDGEVDERAWAGRELTEISFKGANTLKIGPYDAFDYYGDGSFYLLHTPGHAIGHISALARTKANPPEFMFLGGDIAHHGGEFRPSQYLPLPAGIKPSPIATMSVCPGSLFESVHRDPANYSTKPFYTLKDAGIHHDTPTAQESLDRMLPFDAQANVFVAIAHDRTLFDAYEYFPKATANEWRSKGWKEGKRWAFLADFEVKTE